MALDSFYEESARNLNERKQKNYFKICHIAQIVFIVIACVWAWFGFNFIPFNKEEIPSWILFFMLLTTFIVAAVAMSTLKKRFNISYDYICVEGEIRIAKVLNQKKRRLVARIDPMAIIQVGDMESESYTQLRALPGLKEVVCTPNYTAAEGKFFLYVYAQLEGAKKLFLLECREALLINIMQYLRRDVLDREYVPQDKKM